LDEIEVIGLVAVHHHSKRIYRWIKVIGHRIESES
jgi:hypothetical protein